MKMRLTPLPALVLALAVTAWSSARSFGDDPYEAEYLQGNLFYSSSSGSTTISPSGGAYIRFTATETTLATSVHLNLNGSGLTATSMTFGLQADNGSGLPSGTFLASGTVTPASGWNSVTFTGYQLVAGQVYHVVALPATGGNALLRHLTGPPPLTFQTYGVKDTSYMRGVTNVSGVPTGTPSNTVAMVYAVGTTSHGIGLAYQATASNNITATVPLAQRFKFTPSESDQTVLESFTLRLTTGAANLKDIRVNLLSDDNIVLATTTLLASSLTPSGTSEYTISFDDGVILTEDSFYKLSLFSEEATSGVNWVVNRSSSTNAAINSATFQGTDGYAFTFSNTNFTTPQGFVFGDDYVFSYTTSAIPEPGAGITALIGMGVIGLLRRKPWAKR